MLNRTGFIPPAVALAFAISAGTAAAQTMTKMDAQPLRVQGEISNIESNRMTVKTRDGEQRLVLAPDVKVLSLSPSTADAVAVEAFIGTAGVPEQNEKIKAAVVVIYPQGSTGESGDYLTWDLKPDTAMRNGIVRSVENSRRPRRRTLLPPGRRHGRDSARSHHHGRRPGRYEDAEKRGAGFHSLSGEKRRRLPEVRHGGGRDGRVQAASLKDKVARRN